MFTPLKISNTPMLWLTQILVAALYIVSGFMTYQYLLSQNIVCILWIGSGIALSALLLGGWRYLWSVSAGALIFNFFTIDSALVSVGVALASIIEAALAFWLLSKKAVLSPNILPNYLSLIALGGGVASIVGSVIGVSILLTVDIVKPENYFMDLLRWWMGDMLGVMLVVPLVLIWNKEKFTGFDKKSGVEFFAIFVSYTAIGQIIFLGLFHDVLGNAPKGYFLFFCMTIVAIRLGMRGVTIVMLITTVQTLLSAYLGIGYFAHDLVESELRNTWLYLFILSLSGVALASYVDKTKRTLALLQLKDHALNVAANGIVITDTDGNIEWANKAFALLTGFDPLEVQGLNPKALVKSGAQDEAFYANLWQTILSGNVWHGELINRRKDGSLYDEEMTITPLKEGQGDFVTHFVAVKQDITARKLQEQLLKESEKNLRQAKEELESILSAATEISIIATDKEGVIKTFNRGAELMLGYYASEMVGKQTPAIIHDLKEILQRGEELSLKLGKPVTGFQVFVENANIVGRETREWTYVRKDKTTLTVSLTVTAVRNQDNDIVGYLGIADDITQRKIAENALKASEERLNLSQEYGEIGSWEADLSSDKQIWSAGLFKLIELPDQENPTWHDFINLVLPEDRNIIYEGAQRHIETGAKYDVEYRILKPNGQIHWMRSAGRAEFSQEGVPIKFIGIAQDVTQRKQMELELQRSNAELEQFAYAVSHDMRQPLRMVSSYLGLLEKALGEKLDDEEQQFLTFALEGAKRMDTMILSLLEYSRVGRKTKAYQLISTQKCLDEALTFLAPLLHESGGSVDIKGEWLELVVIADELTRLLQNLIGNALKYHDENKVPLVQVRASVVENFFRVEVQDNGIGIEPSQINRLFKVFSRLQARSRFDGTGVGLALCRKVVEHHGGKIGVESQGEGFGCTFWFELPMTKIQDTAAQ